MRMKKVSSILVFSAIVVILSSCFNKNNWNNNSNGPMANNDVYMRGIKTMPANNTFTSDASMRISRMEPAGDSIRLYTHIIDGDGMFPSGATRGTFRNNWCYLTVNGDPVTQYNVREVQESENVPTVYALVLDHSGSMGSNANKMQEAVRNFINKKKPQDAICIVKYDSHTQLEVPINTNVAALQAQFQSNGLQGYGGTTAIINGIMKGMETIQPSAYRRKVVISFTDGADNSSTVTKEYATWYAQQNNINLCTIDFNHSNYNNFMQELANNTSGTYTYFTNSSQFGNVFDDVVNKMNHSYVVTYKRQTPGYQTVVLRYCGEPQALEANADFSPDRSNAQPIRNTTPPAASSSASSADQPVYYRPASYYNNMPGRGQSNNGGSSGTVRTPPNGNPNTTPPRTPGNNGGVTKPDTSPVNGSGVTKPGSNNGGITKPDTSPANGSSPTKPGGGSNPGSSTKPETSPANGSGSGTKPGNSTGIGSSTGGSNSNSGSMKDTPGQIRDGQGNTGSPTKPAPSNGSGNGSGSNPTKPGSSTGIGSNSGGSNSNSGSMKDTPGQIRDGQGNTGSPTKPAPSNGSGSGSGSTTKPSSSTGIGSNTKPVTSPASGSGNSGMKDKPVTTSPAGGSGTKPVTTKPSTTKPSSNSDRDNTTKPSTTKPSSSGTSNPTKPASGASGDKKVNGINPSRGPQ
jgi:Mg-chelatase subunit ChlD